MAASELKLIIPSISTPEITIPLPDISKLPTKFKFKFDVPTFQLDIPPSNYLRLACVLLTAAGGWKIATTRFDEPVPAKPLPANAGWFTHHMPQWHPAYTEFAIGVSIFSTGVLGIIGSDKIISLTAKWLGY